MFSLPSSGGGAPLPGPGWDQEHPPSGFAIQAKEKRKRAAARIVKGSIHSNTLNLHRKFKQKGSSMDLPMSTVLSQQSFEWDNGS